MNHESNFNKDACGGDCGCNSGMKRRDFVRVIGLGALALTGLRMPAMAGPFEAADFDKLVPADKKLDPAWVKSLFARGTPEVLRGGELKYVGMPVGGIGAGQLYLGGDGRLWHWDIFNAHIGTGSEHYAKPPLPASRLKQRFSLTIGEKTRTLDAEGFSDISFRGEYPIGTVEYMDAGAPVAIKLEAFSPFIPLNTDDSGLPATVMEFTVHNTSSAPVEAMLSGELENGVCINNRKQDGVLRQQHIAGDGCSAVLFSAEKSESRTAQRPDIVFEDWSSGSYGGWKVEGTAFGSGPIRKSDIPAYQGDIGGDTERVVNSHATAPGNSEGEKDKATGKLTSRDFIIERNLITCWIGGGKARANSRFGLTLFVEDKPVQTIAGQNKNKMALERFDVRGYAGKKARLEILDDATDGWGNIGIGKITLTDSIAYTAPLEKLPDFGTMALGLIGRAAEQVSPDNTSPFTEKPSGTLGRKLKLAAGESAKATFVVAWHFPNLSLQGTSTLAGAGRYYAKRFPDAHAVAQHIAKEYDRLASQTKLWRATWYDSTLPFWFLDRTFLNTSILATSTCYRFANGRFYGWEGVGCCPGTCTHVYHYAHAAARVFPELERDTRERVDFGLAIQPDGAINFRAESNRGPAVDGQAGTILRALREHEMSSDDAFLKRNWPKIKKATQWLIAKDGNADGIIEGNQHNTLDADWFGPVAWLSGLYLAALFGAAEMADVAGDAEFARQCRDIAEVGRKNLVAQLFDGEYFINKVDPKHLDAINSGTGCEIDQVFGQSWAFQVGLPRVLPEKETRTALRSLWRYNFSPDVGPYRAVNKPGRWYAMAGEAGLLMCTFPRTDWDYKKAAGKGNPGFVGYFNECMNGFEYQVAGHMIWEGMTQEGLAITRAVHDRYHASRRNPWNEIECGDHYARSMASYGVFLAACGYEYNGPKGHLGFAPRLTPENFKAPFTAAEGWGSYTQQQASGNLEAALSLKCGTLRLRTLRLALAGNAKSKTVLVKLAESVLPATCSQENDRVLVAFATPVELKAGETLEIKIN